MLKHLGVIRDMARRAPGFHVYQDENSPVPYVVLVDRNRDAIE